VIADAAEQTRAWEEHKQQEKGEQRGLLDGVAQALTALTRADKLQKKAARAGFDWPDIGDVFHKVEEELGELHDEIDRAAARDALLDESGDLLFAVVNLLRHAGIDPEAALRHSNRKFVRRFEKVESLCNDAGMAMSETDPVTLNHYWERVKAAEASR
jgi:MazG family protein